MYLHSQMSVEPTDQVAIATEVHCVAESTTRVTFFCLFPLAVPFNKDAGLRNKQQHTHTHAHFMILLSLLPAPSS